MYLTRYIPDFILSLYALYFTQGLLYPQGSFLSKTCIILILLISVFYLIKSLLLKNRKSVFYYAWTALFVINLIGYFIKFDFSQGPVRDMFKSISACLLPFYPFYCFSRKNILKSDHLIRFLIIMIPIIIFQYFRNESLVRMEMNSDTAAIVNNLGYSFTGLMPFVFLINKKKIISGLLMAVLLVFIIQSSKRGAIIAGSFALIMYFYLQLITIGKNERISGYIIVPLLIAGLALFVYRESASNELLINRMTSMTEGNTSGRDVIYRTLLDHWYNKDNVFNLLFGFGFASSLDITGGSYAHNDWLELLSNFGIFGVLVYITLFFSALSLFFNKLWPEEKRILFLTILIIWFFISLVSMWYTSVEGFMQASLMGYILGNESPDPDQNFHSIST
jgi:hypothetical protein